MTIVVTDDDGKTIRKVTVPSQQLVVAGTRVIR
jgi:hypothetical protein